MPDRTAPPPTRRAFLALFALFAGTIAFALAGSALMRFAPAQAAASFTWFDAHVGLGPDDLIRAPTWAYMALLPLLALSLYAGELGPRRSVGFLAWGAAVGATAELVGTNTGVPFGAYSYGDWLGPKIAGDVPYFIPPSWYALSVVSLDLARRMGLARPGRVLAAAALMVLWDVALDPAMNHAFPMWSYRTSGVYFGMPLVNWAGWLLPATVIALGYETLLGGLAPRADPFVGAWGPRLYAANVLFPVGICLLFGAPLAGLAGLAALGVALGLVRWRERGAAPPAPQRRPEAGVAA
jgi:putative membrane protein